MPSDAKFGLVIGLGLVLLIALLFFRRDAASQVPAAPARSAPAAPKIAPPPPRVELPKVELPKAELPAPKVAPPPDEIDDLPPPAFGPK